jgi:lipoprotein NlpD
MQRFRIVRIACILLTAFTGALTACSGQRTVSADSRTAKAGDAATHAKPQIDEQSLSLRQPERPIRTVVHGDTLYSIAWESGQDYRELAKWNQISPPYTIKPGQTLRVLPPTENTQATAKSNATSKDTNKITTNSSSKTGKAVASTDRPKAIKNTRTVPSYASGKTPVGSWAWPADGQLLKRYSDSGSGKGLDIGGKHGQPIRAAAGGRIVYQGSGLRGYGQLIIIKHSDEFLSAYAHNDKIYVKEGDVVKRGQKIADMGSTGTDRVKLHFEIRRQGVPTDPLKYLPKR